MSSNDEEVDRAFKNISRMLEIHGLDRHIQAVVFKTADRFFFEAHPTILPALSHAVARGEFHSSPSSGGPHNMVYQLFEGNFGPQRTWRSVERPSLQVTITEIREDMRRWVGDADIDLANPLMDVLGFFTHLVEVIMPGKTSHKGLEKTIARKYDQWARRKENV